jgi:signal peptidase I
MSQTTPAASGSEPHDNTVIETLQSLIVAFVLAMTFRGFVTEGFVIPTGSMAPTLYGQHKQFRSEGTGWQFAAGVDERIRDVRLDRLPDPMLGPDYPSATEVDGRAARRMGDRILVLKSLYHFAEPSRFDVVVFKNPTNPNGADGNYIKRLIGLSGEAVWLVDGDVFAGPTDACEDYEAYRIQRKPEHVQRAVWQPVYDSDFFPRHPDVFYQGPPWTGAGWTTMRDKDDETADRAVFATTTSEPTTLEWDPHIRTIDDWAPYNLLVQRAVRQRRIHVNDVRVAATLVPEGTGLETTFEFGARGHVMQFRLAEDAALLRMRSAAYGDEHPDEGWVGAEPVAIDPLPAGQPTRVEFWHVDQTLVLFINGNRVSEYGYDWRPEERLLHSTAEPGEIDELATAGPSSGPTMQWHFAGSPLEMTRVEVGRDLYYRQDRISEAALKNPPRPGYEDLVRVGQYAAATHPRSIAVLGDDHFFMAGDNSPASSDSRLWGNPHPLVATQIDPSPFLVHRKLLLGKAWVVYFPAPHAVSKEGRAFIPDFGRLRFIR